MELNTLLQQAQTSVLPDQTKAPAQFERTIPPEGLTTARLVGYVEMGKVPNMYEGKEKGTQLKGKLIFELNGPKHIREADDGTKSTSLYYEDIGIKTGEKASFRKLFMKMRNGRESITNMAQMLGEPFLIRITHSKGKGDKADVTYANIRNAEGEWGVQPPMIEDPVTGDVRMIPVPEVTQPYRLLLWSNPSKEQWDSLYVDGTYTKTVNGVEKEVSKNWLQNAIMKEALDFSTSPLHDILSGLGDLTLDEDAANPDDDATDLAADAAALEGPAVASEPAKVQTPPETPKAAAAEPTKPADPAPVEEKKPAQSVDDVFAELGLNP